MGTAPFADRVQVPDISRILEMGDEWVVKRLLTSDER
jgi:hypothetical protein